MIAANDNKIPAAIRRKPDGTREYLYPDADGFARLPVKAPYLVQRPDGWCEIQHADGSRTTPES